MGDKILTEAFDKMKAIEESEDPFCIGAKGDTPITEYTEIGEASRSDNLGRLEHHMDNLRDGIAEFTELQEELFQYRERLAKAIRIHASDDYESWKAYGLARLSIIAGSEEYASHDDNIGGLIEQLTDEYENTKKDIGAQ